MTNNPFLDEFDDDQPLDLDDFIVGGLTPRKLVASLVRKAALKAAAVEEGAERESAVAVADASMASMIARDDDGDCGDGAPSRVGKKKKKKTQPSAPLSLPPPSALLLENILHEFER